MKLFERIFVPERGARPAILFEHRAVTYEQLRQETLRVAGVLHGLGVVPGDRVALLLADSPEFVASFVGIISLGAVAVPINLALRQDEQIFILNDCGARAAIVEASVAAALCENLATPADLKNFIVVARKDDCVVREVSGVPVQDFAA